MLPACRQATYAAFPTIGEDDQGVVPEKLWNICLVILEIVVICMLKAFVHGFEFNKNKWYAVYIAEQIGAPFIDVVANPQLRDEEIAIVLWYIPVDIPERDALMLIALVFSYDWA